MASELIPLLVVTLIAIWVFIVLVVLFVLGDADGDLWVDTMYRCIFVNPGRIFKYAIWFIFGDRGLKWVSSVYHYVVYSNNCLVQILYLVVIVGGYTIFLYGAAPYIPNAYLAPYHRYTSFIMVGICLVTFVIASVADPGVITEENSELYNAAYPPDGVVFLPDNECTTCKIPKPGRSKHCKLCNVCVARFDHHCVWIANDVGGMNYRWFLLFLVMHALICIYGAVGMILTLYHEYSRQNLWAVNFVHPRTGVTVTTTWVVIAQFLLNRYMSIVVLSFLCIPLAFAMIGFTIYHFIMGFWLNRTTNESCKTPADVVDLYSRGLITYTEDECAVHAQYRTGIASMTKAYNTPWSLKANLLELCRPYMWLQLKASGLMKKEDSSSGALSNGTADVAAGTESNPPVSSTMKTNLRKRK